MVRRVSLYPFRLKDVSGRTLEVVEQHRPSRGAAIRDPESEEIVATPVTGHVLAKKAGIPPDQSRQILGVAAGRASESSEWQ